MKNKGKLCVKMFGNFSVTYEGKSLLGKKAGETQFVYLLQILLYNGRNGVGREQMEEVLFGDREIKDIHHTMQSVIYNTKNKLRKLGLPDANYIYLEKGNFYWTDAIDIVMDVEEFDIYYTKAKETEDENEKLELLLEACHQYTGEFLSAYIGVMWVAAEARRYRAEFYECVEEAAHILRKHEDYKRLEALGRYASKAAPFADWESVTMEALVGMGRYEEAGDLYAETINVYFRERGVRPSNKLMTLMDRLSNQMLHPYGVLESIQKDLEEHDVHGGYLVSYPVFKGIYQMMTRLTERGGQSIYLMLCTIVDSKGNPMKAGEQLDDLSERLGDAICRSVRHGDVINKYGQGQYIVLLVNTTLENCDIVQKRINNNFLVGRQRTGVQYFVKSVICEM